MKRCHFNYNAVRKFNRIAENGFAEAYVEKFVSTMNSYYGLMKHFATYNIRRKIAAMLLPCLLYTSRCV